MTKNDEFYNFKLEWNYNGLDFAIRFHSSWNQIKNEKFHELREKYLEITEEIENLTKYDSEELEEKL